MLGLEILELSCTFYEHYCYSFRVLSIRVNVSVATNLFSYLVGLKLACRARGLAGLTRCSHVSRALYPGRLS